MSSPTVDSALDMRVNKIPLAKLGDQKLSVAIKSAPNNQESETGKGK